MAFTLNCFLDCNSRDADSSPKFTHAYVAVVQKLPDFEPCFIPLLGAFSLGHTVHKFFSSFLLRSRAAFMSSTA